MKRHYKTSRMFLILLALAAMSIGLVAGCAKKEEKAPKKKEKSGNEQYKELQEVAKKETPDEANPIDFNALQAKNPDIIGWIRIPETTIDFPLVQHPTDDTYYLNHTALLEESPNGGIYIERINNKSMTDRNTLIYGHHMEDAERSMFSPLHDYRDQTFFDSHREILIYTPTKVLHYKVFAAYETGDEHILYSNNFSTDAGMQEYLDKIHGTREMGSIFAEDIQVTAQDKIITLSTCQSVDEPERRYLIQAVLIP